MVKEDGVVVNPYEDKAALDYYTYISRYRSLGYLDDSATDKRFAVKFVKGTFEDLEALEKQTGHTYVSAVHSYPVPTNENTLQNLFCINSTVQKDKLTESCKAPRSHRDQQRSRKHPRIRYRKRELSA